jgi:hypothetical protein
VLKIPSTISKVSTLSDGSIRLVVDTQELQPSDKAELMGLHNRMGWMLFSDTGIKESDVPTDPIEFPNQKSLSERLRNALWVLHEKKGGTPEDFETFRHRWMESVIMKVKEKISELDQLN